MLKRVKQNILDQVLFFTVYFVFIICLIFVLILYSKTESITISNGYWSYSQDIFFKYCTYIGDGWFAFFIVVLLGLYRLRYAIYAILCFSITALITQFLKKIIFYDLMRPKLVLWYEIHSPNWHLALDIEDLLKGNSFPSGHTTSAFSICCLVALLSKRKWVGLLMIFVAMLTGYSRVYLSQHFFVDIFWGSIIGCVGTLILFSFLESKKWGNWSENSLFYKIS